MRAMPSFTSRTVPTSRRRARPGQRPSISRRRMSLISPGRSDGFGGHVDRWSEGRNRFGTACENYHNTSATGKHSEPSRSQPAPRSAPDEAPQARRRGPRSGSSAGLTSGDAAGRRSQVAGRGERQDPRHAARPCSPDCRAGRAAQATRAQVDHPLQVRRAAGAELPRQVLARSLAGARATVRRCATGGRRRRTTSLPGAQLERSVKPQQPRGVGEQRCRAAARPCARRTSSPDDRVIHAFDQHAGDTARARQAASSSPSSGRKGA